MSLIKLMSAMVKSLDCINVVNIDPSLQIEFDKILNDFNQQLFLDKDLTHEHRMFLINKHHTIETKFIEFLTDRIRHLNIDDTIRNRLIENVNEFSSDFMLVNRSTNVNQWYNFNDHSDDESYVDDETDGINSDDDEYYDDVENQILDDIEFEHDIIVSSYNTQRTPY